MKIGYLLQAGVPNIFSYPLSGAANHVKLVFDELTGLGHDVCLIVNWDGRIWKSEDFQNFEPVRESLIDKVPLTYFESFVRRIQSELQLPYIALFDSLRFAKACRQELHDFDLLYERMGWMGYGGALASRWLKKPLVLEVNGDHLTEMELQGNAPEGVQRHFSEKVTKFAARQAAYSIATGEGWRRKYIQRWDIAPEKVSVIENGSELVELLDRDRLQSFSDNEHTSSVQIAYVGGFDPWQGVPILINAVSQAVSQGLDIHLLLIGGGKQEGEIKAMISRLRLEDRVTFTGHVSLEQMAAYLENVDIGVSPYCGRDEYSGLKLLDYKAAGLAIIASGLDGEPEVIAHGRSGWIVPPCDDTALFEAINLLVSNDELRRQLGQTARIEAESEHSWQHTAVQIENACLRIVNETSNEWLLPAEPEY
ncbi:MAG: glycosyltransferase family 4 protein [Anaerolineales bacterium]